MANNDFNIETTIYPGFINVETRTDKGIGICIDVSQIDCGTLMLTHYEALQLARWLVQYLVE